jgi:hypothetical protein
MAETEAMISLNLEPFRPESAASQVSGALKNRPEVGEPRQAGKGWQQETKLQSLHDKIKLIILPLPQKSIRGCAMVGLL